MTKRPLYLLLCFACTAYAAEPVVKWSYEGQSNLYGPPLVADIHPNPGLESVMADSEAKRLRCIGAQGQPLWEYDGGWKKRLISTPALNARAGLIAIANADGGIRCVEAGTGAERWRSEVGLVEWGGVLWSDIDGDGVDELAAGLDKDGVAALDAEGKLRWHYRGKQDLAPLQVRCPLASGDINDDKKNELFGCGLWGPFCLNGDGTLLWERNTGDDFISAPVLAGDTLYCASRNDNLLWAFDAKTGEPHWSSPLLGGMGPYTGASIAPGDIDQDGAMEIIVGDAAGHLNVFGTDGTLRWTFSTGQPVHIAATLGDVDGDGEIESLAASGDHGLYCIDSRGALKWKYTTGLRLVYPPTLADIDNDGKTEILACGSDHVLRCLTLGGRYRQELIPWPSRRGDAAQQGVFQEDPTRATRILNQRVLFIDGDFEVDKTADTALFTPENAALKARRETEPRGWLRQGVGTWTLDTAMLRSGKRSLRLEGACTVSTVPIPLDPGLQHISLSVWVRSTADISMGIAWSGDRGEIPGAPVSTLTKAAPENGWTPYTAAILVPPASARWLRLNAAAPADTVTWIDAIQVTGTFAELRTARALVNQVGYDNGAPKHVTVQANWKAERSEFLLLNKDGKEAFRAPLEYKGRIKGQYGPDWGHEYYRGDFSAFNEAGHYRVRIVLDGVTDDSWPFEVGNNVLWNATARPAYRFFYYQRCGTEVPGLHPPCHLDDAAGPEGTPQHELAGGWHDAGDYNKYQNAPYVYGLGRAYSMQQAAFDLQDEDRNGQSDFLDEILWGGEHVRRMIAPDGSAYGDITAGYGYWGPAELETDNRPGTGDERRIHGRETGNDPSLHAAAMARIAASVSKPGPWAEAAEHALHWALGHQLRGVLEFSAAVDLYRATQNEAYARLAKELLPTPAATPETADALRRYDEAFHEDHTQALHDAFVGKMEELLALAENPFGVYTFGSKENPNFFSTHVDTNGWHVGTNSHLLEGAAIAALTFQYEPDPRYLAFAYDQFNWVLGGNPYDISLMEGCGSAFPPSYHQRLTFAGVKRGAVPGSVVNGITWRAPGDDRPFFDMSGADIPAYESNEVWLPHNTNYLNALANLHAVMNGEQAP